MKYKALTNIHHDNTHYAPGDEMELSGAEAAQLLDMGAIEPLVKPFAAKFTPTKLNSGAQGE